MDSILEQRLASLGEHIKQRTRERQAQTIEAPATALVIPFPHPWAEAVRACPLPMLRSALFGVVRRGRRQYLENVELLPSWSGVSVHYQGMRLDQADLDVWMQAVHLFRQQGLGGRLYLSAYSFLKAIGCSTGKHDYQWLERSFTRMIACAVKIDTSRYRYAGNLVHEFWYDKKNDWYVLSINPHLAELFKDGYSLIEWEQRSALGNKDLAKWLLGYVATHQATVLKPHYIGLDKLQRLSGSDDQPRHFKYLVRCYMAELQALGAVASWYIEGADSDVLKFIRPMEKASRKSRKRQ